MAAQGTEKEDPDFKPPLSLPSSTISPVPPRRFTLISSAARPAIRRESPSGEVGEKREVNRCSGCRKKVGLTGFRCRCGDLFCSEHRYSDRHVCGYDYKAVGREAIARENPIVKAAKIIRI